MKAKRWILVKQFSGNVSEENIQLEEFDLPNELAPGEVLLQAVYLSVDPYMRIFPIPEGSVMVGEQLSEVIKTRNGKYPLGTLVLSKAGWISHYISKGDGLSPICFDLGATPISYTLGILGMPGATAYFGLEKSEPKKNETFLVTAAAGAVGSIVGQLAKLKGLKVIGIVGSDDKANLCKNDLGFDHVINYKKENFSEVLSQVAPEGIDIYYDNVGGEFYHTIINKHMRNNGRIVIIGSIQNYNDKDLQLVPQTNSSILMKQLTVKGLHLAVPNDRWSWAFSEMNELIQKGKLKAKETVYVGFENMRNAFFGLFKGDNTGKAVVKAVNAFTHYGER